MNVCNRRECQTTAGCAYRGPRGEYCWIAGSIPNPPSPPPKGCICPPTAEQTCQAADCPRRGFVGTVTHVYGATP
jgi:hypothetical protein